MSASSTHILICMNVCKWVRYTNTSGTHFSSCCRCWPVSFSHSFDVASPPITRCVGGVERRGCPEWFEAGRFPRVNLVSLPPLVGSLLVGRQKTETCFLCQASSEVWYEVNVIRHLSRSLLIGWHDFIHPRQTVRLAPKLHQVR